MKRLYWRPARASRPVLLLVFTLAVVGMVAVEKVRIRTRQPHYKDKVAASRLAATAMHAVKAERLKLGIPVDKAFDPSESGLIGPPMSEVTSHSGILDAKQTSANPNWAGVMVHHLLRAGAKRGQLVALGLTGSFPAINIATLAAVKQLGLRPVIISSTSGSQYGANMSNFLWLDMEAALKALGIFPFVSDAASLGGVQDQALGMAKEGRALLEAAIKRRGVKYIQPKDLPDAVEARMAIYQEKAGDEDYVAYINVGGGSASVGTFVGKKLFKPGLNRTAPRGTANLDAVMTRFIQDGVPVIHMVKLDMQAARYGLPLQPVTTPPVGQGQIFYREEYSPWLAAAVLALIVVFLFVFVRTDLGSRLLKIERSAKGGGDQPQKMV